MLSRRIRDILRSRWTLVAVAVVAIGFTAGLLYSGVTRDATVAQTPPGPPPDLPTPIGTPSPDMIPKPTQFYSASDTSTPKHPPHLAEFFASEEYKTDHYTESSSGPHTAGIALGDLQLPSDVYIGEKVDRVSCTVIYVGDRRIGANCPDAPLYKLVKGDDFVWIDSRHRILEDGTENIGSNPDAFPFLTEDNDDEQ